MNNPLAKVMGNKVVKQVTGSVSKYILEHENTVLTGTTIAFNAAGIAVTYRNSPKIHHIISETKTMLAEEDMNEWKKKELYKTAIKELIPLVTPIIFFFGGSTAAAIVNQKKSEAKIATLTAALSLAQTTISEYDAFKEEVKKEVGEEKFKEIKNEVNNQMLSLNNTPSAWKTWRDMGYEIVWIPAFDYYFPSTKDKLEIGWKNIDMIFERNGRDGRGYGYEYNGHEVVTYADVIRELAKQTTEVHFEPYNGNFTDLVGWEAGKTPYISHWIGTFSHPNGMTGLTVEISTTPTYI